MEGESNQNGFRLASSCTYQTNVLERKRDRPLELRCSFRGAILFHDVGDLCTAWTEHEVNLSTFLEHYANGFTSDDGVKTFCTGYIGRQACKKSVQN